MSGHWAGDAMEGIITFVHTNGNRFMREVRANKQHGKQTAMFTDCRIINSIYEKNAKDCEKKVEATEVFYTADAQPLMANAQNWQDYVKEPVNFTSKLA